MERKTIIGVGCAGGRIVNHLIEAGRIDSEFAAINTDRQELEACKASVKLLIGERRTQGYGGMPSEIAEEIAEDSAQAIAAICAGKESVMIVAGLGGGTGTGAAPVIARIARRHGCQTVAVVMEPFPFEGKRRVHRATAGLQALAGVDLLMKVRLGDLLPVLGRSITLRAAWHAGATVAATTVEFLPTLLTKPGPEGCEVVDVQAVWALRERAYGVAQR